MVNIRDPALISGPPMGLIPAAARCVPGQVEMLFFFCADQGSRCVTESLNLMFSYTYLYIVQVNQTDPLISLLV